MTETLPDDETIIPLYCGFVKGRFEMNLTQIIAQLSDLMRDRMSFLSGESEHDEVYNKDIQALKFVIEFLGEKLENVEEMRYKHKFMVSVNYKSGDKKNFYFDAEEEVHRFLALFRDYESVESIDFLKSDSAGDYKIYDTVSMDEILNIF